MDVKENLKDRRRLEKRLLPYSNNQKCREKILMGPNFLNFRYVHT